MNIKRKLMMMGVGTIPMLWAKPKISSALLPAHALTTTIPECNSLIYSGETLSCPISLESSAYELTIDESTECAVLMVRTVSMDDVPGPSSLILQSVSGPIGGYGDNALGFTALYRINQGQDEGFRALIANCNNGVSDEVRNFQIQLYGSAGTLFFGNFDLSANATTQSVSRSDMTLTTSPS